MGASDPGGEMLVPHYVVDEWMPRLFPSQFRIVMQFLRHGYIGRHTLPFAARGEFARRLGLSMETVRPALRQLVQLGLLIERNDTAEPGYVLNREWRP